MNKMRKTLFGILALVLVTGCSFKINGEINENDGTNNKLETIDYTNYIKNNNILEKVIEKEITVNDDKHKLVFIYSYVRATLDDSTGEPCSDCNVFNHMLNIMYDNKLVDSNEILIQTEEDKGQTPSTKYIKDENIKLIKDIATGREYIVVYYLSYGVNYANNNVIIADENFDIVYSNTISEGFGVNYTSDYTKKIPYVEINDNAVTILVQDDCTSAHKEKITVKSGHTSNEKIEFTEKIEISGGC